ncbi:hypothetical protein BpHYR1_008770 [Brachionus plicatilis]|uniref:Uncharacterized protein n=1 Tax=Brachionus plicatilis TaxID=10195 RepID=A0A3M7PCT3_BRAPC|nr:hypothetical protein BpHYR1_008770 [Brachionus plicatilis]
MAHDITMFIKEKIYLNHFLPKKISEYHIIPRNSINVSNGNILYPRELKLITVQNNKKEEANFIIYLFNCPIFNRTVLEFLHEYFNEMKGLFRKMFTNQKFKTSFIDLMQEKKSILFDPVHLIIKI